MNSKMKINGVIALSLFFLILSCSNEKDNKDISSNPKNEAPTPSEDDIDSVIVVDPKFDSIPLITGSCAEGRDVGEMSQYRIKMKIGTSSTGDISVRSDAACFEIGACNHNILGKIPSGTIIYAQGPLKNRGGSAGIAYAFPVRDKDDNICRGYMSYVNVLNIAPKEFGHLPDGNYD